ncbi:MAG: PEP/pyruvate-binding domain-containing protein [Deltaproteobacteria bacterium]|nr:PEP/pyruvate-binding domain-containing protein [Deltaproteobacteria bacterium]
MGHVFNFIRSLFSKKEETTPADVEELRNAFKERYHHFKLLLSANNKALEIMAEMEAALKGTYPFGMTFVRSRLTLVSASVWQITRHLNELAPGKYEVLYDRFKEIHIKINPFIRIKPETPSGAPLVIPMASVTKEMADEVGSKMANIGEIRNRLRLSVADGFVITAEGYRRFISFNELETEIARLIQATPIADVQRRYGLSADLQQLIIRAQIPPDLEAAMNSAYRSLREEGTDVRVAMRSSALGEDVAGTSFAGQYRSELNVSGENILQAYKEIVASKYSLPAMTYRFNRGIRDEDVAMCVGCMRMVEARSGGVAYSRNPVNIRDDAVFINSAWGLPKSVVDGTVVPDLFIVSRDEPVRVLKKQIQSKSSELVCLPGEGLERMTLKGEVCGEASLSDPEAVELARVAIRLETYYGGPQDVEWAVDPVGDVVILQCRTLTQKAPSDAADASSGVENSRAEVLYTGGLSVSPGVAAGKVSIVRKDMDALTFPEDAVLVAEQGLPRWASTLNRAAAVVIQQGSMAGHLANVAREFDVPGLFGVENATGRFHEGQLITVDADGQTIYAGRVEALLRGHETPRHLMKDSPVYNALKGVAQYVTPLNLLDPDSVAFRPKNCETFHDITRFSHEKAVHEMFQFGKSHRFPERSAKQLFCDVPMQWFVLNLDDGFKEEVSGKYVKLDNIVSIPMRALWEGIIATPWGGPPPVDGKGFLSVMFQATTNRALNTGVRSAYANRNYFMISRHYVSLNSRFGFHFSIVEAMVSERVNENYINFQFKGGAADLERRLGRVHFVREILEPHGFRVTVRSDTLIARLENHEADVMKARLKMLGYLIIHTRQLDMVMANPSMVDHYRSKMIKEITALLD